MFIKISTVDPTDKSKEPVDVWVNTYHIIAVGPVKKWKLTFVKSVEIDEVFTLEAVDTLMRRAYKAHKKA